MSASRMTGIGGALQVRFGRELAAGVIAGLVVFATAAVASAHCCHDPLSLGTHMQSTFRRGLHGMDDGITDDSVETDPPTVNDNTLNGPGTVNSGIGGLGQMQGNSLGNYGAGSVGQPGPGGLGSLRTGGIGPNPVRPH